METRWVAFRDTSTTSLGTAVPASLPVGKGWRGGYVRTAATLDDFDDVVQQLADATGAAVGVWCSEEFCYGVAAARDHTAIPFLLRVDPASPPEGSDDILARCGVGPSYAAWRQHTSQALAAWSVHTPYTVDPLDVDAVLRITEPDVDVAEVWCRLFGMAVPVDRAPGLDDEAARARAELTSAAQRKRQRRSPDMAW